MMKVISLGWGTQSFTLAAMVALGELEPVDFAINADTTHERTATYDFAKRWTPWLEERGVKVVTVRPVDGRINVHPERLDGEVEIPGYVSSPGDGGRITRQCTKHWKIEPMHRVISIELKLRGLNKTPGIIEQWLGISLDEFQRMKESDVKYIVNRWPLIERKMTRHDCQLWLERHGLEIPPRSACVFCPFHSKSQWRDIRDNAPEDWQKAVEVDKQIRKARPPYDLFVNNQRKPLEECDLDSPQDKGQMDLWDDNCEGYCGI
jgi:hypothetical protein